MDMSNVHDLLEKHKKIEDAIRDELAKLFKSQPECEEINKVSSAPFVATASISTLAKHGNWSPEFYNFRHQWELLQGVLESRDRLSDQIERLKNVAASGKMAVSKNGFRYTAYFHPDVCKRLKEILEN